jgi:hypothetical protein
MFQQNIWWSYGGHHGSGIPVMYVCEYDLLNDENKVTCLPQKEVLCRATCMSVIAILTSVQFLDHTSEGRCVGLWLYHHALFLPVARYGCLFRSAWSLSGGLWCFGLLWFGVEFLSPCSHPTTGLTSG